MENLLVQNVGGRLLIRAGLALFILTGALLLSCTETSEETLPGYDNRYQDNQSRSGLSDKVLADETSVQELRTRHEAGKPLYLLDVRTRMEFVSGRLPFTDQLIPYDAIPYHIESLPLDESVPIYVFCRSGRRSRLVTDFLRNQGYQNVSNVTGGILAWQEAGFGIASGESKE